MRYSHATSDDDVRRLTARVTRIQGLLDKVRSVATASPISDQRDNVDTGADADARRSARKDERQRVELELLSSVLPLG